MQRERTEITVLGGGAGLALAWALALQGWMVTVLDRAEGMASTLRNQKWKHSGLLYLSGELARKMWAAFVQAHPLERRHLRARGGDFLAHSGSTLAERAALWRDWGIPFAPLVALPDGPLGTPKAAGGFAVPDSVIDFPALLPDLAREAAGLGVRLLPKARVDRLIRDGDRLTGLLYDRGGVETLLEFERCVVAAGAWAPDLLAPLGVELPVRRSKCHILTLEGELVERITARLDSPALTLVPYRGRTLVADGRRFPVEDGWDRDPVPEGVEALMADLRAAYPRCPSHRLRVVSTHGCLKAEADFTGRVVRNQDLAVFDAAWHGVPGLTVVFPGKASLMFALAAQVAEGFGMRRPLRQEVAVEPPPASRSERRVPVAIG